MNKQQIMEALSESYNTFIEYIGTLSDENFLFRHRQKWTAGQQLNHLILCVTPLVKIFGMDNLSIEEKFGRLNRPSDSYEGLMNQYKEKTKEGGIAPPRFLPETIGIEQRDRLCEELTKLVQQLCLVINNFTEHDLDTLAIPHPVLGNLTLREMLFNTIYHVKHHEELTKHYLSLNRKHIPLS